MGMKCESLTFQNVERGHKKILLDGRKLNCLPKELFTATIISSLTLLDISNNKLLELPTEIKTLKKLNYLYINGNQLSRLGSNLSCLTNLKVLDLSRNAISNIPDSFGNFRELEYLNLSGNCIKILPLCVISLPSLKKLFLVRNPRLQNIPKDVALAGLEAIRIYFNITGLCDNKKICNKSYAEIPFTDCVFKRNSSIFEGLVKLFAEQMKLTSDFRHQILSRKLPDNNFVQSNKKTEIPHKSHKEFFCNNCNRENKIYRQLLHTSEYGSMTECPDVGKYIVCPSIDSCDGNTGSFTSEYDINNETFSSIESEKDMEEEKELVSDFEYHFYIDAFQDVVIINKGIKLTIPKRNISGHSADLFDIDMISDDKYKPILDSWSVLASNIVHLGPHGTKFYTHMPATVKIPISVCIEPGDNIKCYTSDTDLNEPTDWEVFVPKNLHIAGSYVQFEVTHFSLFAVVVTKPRPKTDQKITSNGGDVLLQNEKDVIKVHFPPHAFLVKEICASIELLYYDTFYVSTELFSSDMHALAGPVISLGPDGCQFNANVSVTIPLPKGKEFLEWHSNPSLLFMCSQTVIGCKPDWQVFVPDHTINWDTNPCTVTFEVNHFTMFSVFWNVLDATLPEHLKLHASSHVPHFSFWVYYQAFMTDCNVNKQFGLCVMCHRLGNQTIHGLHQYPCEVGCCKPRKVKTGKFDIQLKSGMFEADQSVGESLELSKVVDFAGHDFDVHFACKFNTDTVPEVGLFGKVEISPLPEEDGEQFSFNLIKSVQNNKSNELGSKKSPTEWESKVTKELAGMLSIDDHMWRELALALGYNRLEIQTKFSAQLEPIHEMLADFMSRGGTPDEFTSAMYKVARMFKLVPLNEIRENQENRRLEAMQRKRQMSEEQPGFCVSNASHENNIMGKRKSDALYSKEPLSESKFDDIAAEISKSWKSIGRKLNVSEPELREIELNYQHSGEKEKAFQMLIAWRERDPDNCVSGTLFTVLHNSGLKYTASKCMQ